MSWPEGPAFPTPDRHDASGLLVETGYPGISQRQWFAAHAPAEPAPWFKPVVPQAPEVPDFYWAPEAIRTEVVAFRNEEIELPDLSEPARAWIEQRLVAQEAREAWERARDVARTAQWPWAWADLVLNAEGVRHA